jgi:LemA protein
MSVVRKIRHPLSVSILLCVSLFLSSCGYNRIQKLDEETKSSWSQVLNQYQRRADLIPNLVNTVKGYASHEKEVLTSVIEARAKATSIQVSADKALSQEELQKFEAAQQELTGALSRLLVIAENYPQLKADQSFRDLQTQLEGTENRITVARDRYIRSIQDYNVHVRSFPTNLTAKVFGYGTKANFTVQNEKEIATPPSVDFSK